MDEMLNESIQEEMPVKGPSKRSKVGVGSKSIKSKGKSGNAQRGLKTQKKGIGENQVRKRGRPALTEAQKKANAEKRKAEKEELKALQKEYDRLGKLIAKRTGKETSAGMGLSKETVVGEETGASKETVGRALEKARLGAITPLNTVGADLPEGTNTKIISIGLKILALPEIDLRDVGQVAQRLEEYFRIYAEADMKPTVLGMANSLGIDRRRLWEIVTNQSSQDSRFSKESAELVRRTYGLLNQYWEEYMQSGKINPVSGIFLGKNHFGYRDQSDFVVTAHADEETIDSDAIRQRYIDSDSEE